jgi:ligand-binding sensor domain-containing protein/signal transduction histidine kinase
LRPFQAARWRQLIACWLAILCTSSLAEPLRTLRFEQVSVEQGLAQETTTAILQDRQGYMWFGSQGGLSRYDGYQVTVYRNLPGDARSLADNWVLALHCDERNRLWIGTRGGLQRYDAERRSFTRFVPDGPLATGRGKHQIRAIAGDGHGKLWLATSDGLQLFDPDSGRFSALRHDASDAGSLDNDTVTALARDAHGSLWVGTEAGVNRLPRAARHFEHLGRRGAGAQAAAPSDIRALIVDSRQTLWIATALGLETWQTDGGAPARRRYGPADGLQPGLITALFEDRNGDIWLGTNSHGLHHWNARSRRFVTFPIHPHTVAGGEVSALYQDRTGTLWVGTWTAGVKHVDLGSGGFSRHFHVPDDKTSLSDDRILAITDDGQGRLWLGTFGGLNRLDPATSQAAIYRRDERHPNNIPNAEVVVSVFRDRQAQLWVGTGSALGRFDPVSQRFTPRRFHTGDPNSEAVNHIASDRAGMLWIATRGGLHRLDPLTNKVRTYRHDPNDPASLVNDWVKMTLEDQDGTLWIATDDGLDRLDPASGRFSHFHGNARHAFSLRGDSVHYLFKDSKGTLWIGTDAGLNRKETAADGAIRFLAYGSREGLGSDSIGGILEDDSGRLWLSTATGISRFDMTSKTFRNYTARDGMIDGYYYVGSAFRDRGGTMYFGGVNGLTRFRPENIRDNPAPPPVLITDIQVAGRSVQGDQQTAGIELVNEMKDGMLSARTLRLSHRYTALSLTFSALHFADPQRNRYAYQLQGFDKGWTDVDASKRSVSYTNLDPGHYQFRVKAANKDGVWSDAEATLSITVTPPFWGTWWFRSGLLLLMAGGTFLVHRARVRVMSNQMNLLEEQVRIRTSEVTQQKNIVEQKNELLQGTQNQLQQYFDDRERLFISISHDLRTPITRLKLRSDLLDDEEMREEFYDDLDELETLVKGALQLVKDSDIHENITEVRLDPMIGRMIRGTQLAGHDVSYVESGLALKAKPLALKRVLGNLLDNALHYGQRAEISARAKGGHIEIRIRDHGPGVPEAALKTLFEPHVRLEHGRNQNKNGMGLGLSIAHRIVEAHGGKLILDNHPEGGLVATIQLPASK